MKSFAAIFFYDSTMHIAME